MKPKHELADVLRLCGDEFRQSVKLPAHHLRTLRAIEQCRTAALGGHVDVCNSCGQVRVSYNSCRNRHCPKCQAVQRERWITGREADLLPVSYFHLVFTLPAGMNELCMRHPAAMYNLLFRAAWQTTQAFGRDEKHLGADVGMVAILHTWGQNLSLHPHLHCIVPGGGLTTAGRWKNACNKGRFLFPVKAMSKVFRARFTAHLRQWAKQQSQDVPKQFYNGLFAKNWVVYAKRPFLGPKQVIEYLGRYTHKIAISNHRLLDVSKQAVTFKWKDYRKNGQNGVMALLPTEFLRRFCQHILPRGFVRIRHYGFLASRAKAKNLKTVRKQLGCTTPEKQPTDWKVIAREKLHFDVESCPCCKKGKMVTLLHFDGRRGPPPKQLIQKIQHKWKNSQ